MSIAITTYITRASLSHTPSHPHALRAVSAVALVTPSPSYLYSSRNSLPFYIYIYPSVSDLPLPLSLFSHTLSLPLSPSLSFSLQVIPGLGMEAGFDWVT